MLEHQGQGHTEVRRLEADKGLGADRIRLVAKNFRLRSSISAMPSLERVKLLIGGSRAQRRGSAQVDVHGHQQGAPLRADGDRRVLDLPRECKQVGKCAKP